MASFRQVVPFCFMVATLQGFAASSTSAININLDYTYDTTHFFGSGNPAGATAGAEAKLALESAADFFSGILTDTFSAIETPPTFNSTAFSGTVTWSWSLDMTNPTTGSSISLVDPTIAANEYRLYVGARSLSDKTLGIGGPGGFEWSRNVGGSGFTSAEINQIDQIHDDFVDAVENRGETSGFSHWGGVVSFDRDSSTDWHFDHMASPSSGKSDFFSTAIHEIGHALGLGASDNWNNWVSGANYTGPKAVNLFNGLVPLDCDSTGCGHWASGTESVILGTTKSQEAAMDPSLLEGTRKRLTALDAAGLEDIGWSVVSPTFSPADYNFDGDVDSGDLATLENGYGVNGNGDADGDGDTDGADFLIWQKQFSGPQALLANVPEPTSVWLLVLGLAMTGHRRQNRNRVADSRKRFPND